MRTQRGRAGEGAPLGLLAPARLRARRGLAIAVRDARERVDARNITELAQRVCDLDLGAFDVACIAQVADESRVLLDSRLPVARKCERCGKTAVRGEVSRVEGDRLAQQTDRRGPLARPAERG